MHTLGLYELTQLGKLCHLVEGDRINTLIYSAQKSKYGLYTVIGVHSN